MCRGLIGDCPCLGFKVLCLKVCGVSDLVFELRARPRNSNSKPRVWRQFTGFGV